MTRAFFDIAFTANVKALQSRMGSRDAYGVDGLAPAGEPALGAHEISFIEARDSFYLGTVGETGWPYVQHRGGPAGFLKVLDAHTIGFADFTGNRQYVSAGNLAGDDRVSLFLMDYPNQARLKILGRARVVEEAGDPALLARLDNPRYRARVERGIVVRVEGFDWNCPKYITPRYTEDEVARRIREATAGIAARAPRQEAAHAGPIGNGVLPLVVTGVRQLTPRIRAYELRAGDGGELPPAPPGAHLEVPARLDDGSVAVRQYSLAMDPGRRDAYEIAVLRVDGGRGGSRAIHGTWEPGTRIRASPPASHFPLHAGSRPAILVAGGVGITPIKSMAQALRRRGAWVELHYTARTPDEMAYRDVLAAEFASGLFTYFSRVPGHRRLDVEEVLRRAPVDALVYACGPDALVEAVRAGAHGLGIAPERVRHESFG